MLADLINLEGLSVKRICRSVEQDCLGFFSLIRCRIRDIRRSSKVCSVKKIFVKDSFVKGFFVKLFRQKESFVKNVSFVKKFSILFIYSFLTTDIFFDEKHLFRRNTSCFWYFSIFIKLFLSFS